MDRRTNGQPNMVQPTPKLIMNKLPDKMEILLARVTHKNRILDNGFPELKDQTENHMCSVA